MLDNTYRLSYHRAAHTAAVAKAAQQAAAAAAQHRHSSITPVAAAYHLSTVGSSSTYYSGGGWVGFVARCIYARMTFMYIHAQPATHRHDVEYRQDNVNSRLTFYSVC